MKCGPNGPREMRDSCESLMIRPRAVLALLPAMDPVLVPNTPQTATDSQHGGAKGYPIRRTIATSARQTFHVALVISDRVGIVDPPVEDVEDVP